MNTVTPVAGERPYRVEVGQALHAELPALVGSARQAAVLYAAPVSRYADVVVEAIAATGVAPLPVEVPDAEAAKTIEVAARCWDALAGAGFTRTDVVVGVGGGA